MEDWGGNIWKNTCGMFVFKKENKTQTEQHDEWGGERNDSMLTAGFVENGETHSLFYSNSE